MRDRSQELDTAIDANDNPQEIHVHKDYWDQVEKTGDAVDMKDQPVVEKMLGSTRQIGNYNDLPVYSHGREDKDAIFTGNPDMDQSHGRAKGWFKHIPGSANPIDRINEPK